MTQEEKAKAYDEAIERSKNYYSTTDSASDIKLIGLIFPELKESEDERIKDCIGICLTDADEQRFKDFNTTLKNCLAWLEKQGKNDMGISEATKKELEDNLNKALEKETPESWNEFLDEQKPADNIDSSAFKDKLLELFQKFRYTKEGVITNGDIIDYVDAHIQELIGTIQKPADTENGAKGNDRDIPNSAWTEGSEKKIESIIGTIRIRKFEYPQLALVYEEDINWLKSLKERYVWKPSDEQMNALNYVVNLMASSERPTENDLYYNILKSLRQQLKKLKGD